MQVKNGSSGKIAQKLSTQNGQTLQIKIGKLKSQACVCNFHCMGSMKERV